MNRLISKFASRCLLWATVLGPVLTFAQDYTLSTESAPMVWITGESTLHGWEVKTAGVNELPPKIQFTAADGSELSGFVFSVEVDGMDGGRGSSMNKKIKGAFKSAQNPVVKFEQTGSSIIKMSEADAFTADVKGNLSMAGMTKEISLSIAGKVTDEVVEFSGEKDLLMSEYGMEPPSAMFGQIVTDDEVVAHFKITYTKE